MFMYVWISTYISVYYIVFIFIVVHNMSIYDMYILCISRYINCGILFMIKCVLSFYNFDVRVLDLKSVIIH